MNKKEKKGKNLDSSKKSSGLKFLKRSKKEKPESKEIKKSRKARRVERIERRVSEKPPRSLMPTRKTLFLRFSVKDQVFFAKRLSFLIHANVPMLDSLRIVQRQTKAKSKKQMFDEIINDVTNGQFLASSLSKFNKVFGNFAINIIRTGETTGTLDESLAYLAEELEKKQRLQRKVFGSLIYPALIIVATLGVVGLLTIYVFPKILPIFSSLDFELPITTKILIWFTDFVTAWGLWIAGATTLFFIIAAWFIAVQESAHYIWDRVVLKFPMLGKIALNYQVANLTRTLGLLLKTDTGVVDSFKIAAETTKNVAYKRALHQISTNILKGESISSQLAIHPGIFPDLMSQMVAIGERTGRLSDTFMYLSGLYEEEVDNQTKNLSNSIEPLLMITLGLVVGFIAISIITPIYQVTQSLNP